jgi:hypothetical protein
MDSPNCKSLGGSDSKDHPEGWQAADNKIKEFVTSAHRLENF